MDLKTLHAMKSISARPDRKRVGRGPGSGLGKTSGRGQKGAGSRSGHHIRDFYEGGQTPLMRRIPKRGFSNDEFASRFAVINISDLNAFDDGATVDPKALVEQGWIKQPLDGIKILGDGTLDKKLTVKAHRFSKSALEKIQARGGEAVTLLPLREKGPKKKKKLASRGKAKPKAAGGEEAAPAAADKAADVKTRGARPEQGAPPPSETDKKAEKPAAERPKGEKK